MTDDPDATVSALVDERLVEADGTTLAIAPLGSGDPLVEITLRELGPVASIRELLPITEFVVTPDGVRITAYGTD